MRHTLRSARRQSQEGAVAVEAALCMTFVLLPLFLFALVFGKFFWYYTAAQKAIHDATLYMASAPLSEVQAQTAQVLAGDIIAQETADFDSDTTTEPSVQCGYRAGSTIGYRPCTAALTPAAVQSTIVLTVPNPFTLRFSNSSTLADSISIFIMTTMPYVGK